MNNKNEIIKLFEPSERGPVFCGLKSARGVSRMPSSKIYAEPIFV